MDIYLEDESDLTWKQMEVAVLEIKLFDLIICSGTCQDDEGDDNPVAESKFSTHLKWWRGVM